MRGFIISASLSVAMAIVWAPRIRAQNETSRGDVFQWLHQARAAVLAGENDKARKLIDDSRAWAASRKDTLATAWAEQLAGELEFSAGDHAKAIGAFQAALVAFTELKNQAGVANCQLNLGRLALASSKPSKAEESLAKAVDLFHSLHKPSDEAAALCDLATAQQSLMKRVEAKANLQKALAIYTGGTARNSAGEMRAHADLAACCEASGDTANARKHYDAAVVLAAQSKDAVAEAQLRTSFGLLLQKQGNLEDAQKQYDAVFTIRGGLAGDPLVEATLRNNLGALLQEQGKAKEALEQLHKALALFSKQNDESGQARALYNIALVHESADPQSDEAIAAYEQALALRKKLKDGAGAARVLDNLALLFIAAGKSDRAKECRAEAEKLRKGQ